MPILFNICILAQIVTTIPTATQPARIQCKHAEIYEVIDPLPRERCIVPLRLLMKTSSCSGTLFNKSRVHHRLTYLAKRAHISKLWNMIPDRRRRNYADFDDRNIAIRSRELIQLQGCYHILATAYNAY